MIWSVRGLLMGGVALMLAVGGADLQARPQTTQTVLILATGADRMTNGKPTGLWLEELAVPHEALLKAGFDVILATPRGGAIPIDPRSKPTPDQAKAWARSTEAAKSTVALGTVDLARVDGIFVPGGHGTMFDLASDATTAKVIGDLYAQGKVVAAVCHGPAALVQAKRRDGKPLVEGRKVAVFTNEEEEAVGLTKDMPFLLETRLRELGATVEKAANFQPKAVRDGRLITGQNPPSSEPVARLLIEALQERKER
jgi:putative intracellular protease/amidase